MEEVKIKRLIGVILTTLSIVILFLSLCFNIYNIEALGMTSKGNGFSILGSTIAVLEDISTWLGIFSIIIIISFVIETIRYSVCVAKRRYNIINVEKTTIILNVIISFIYLINGAVATSKITEQLEYGNITNGAYVPFILHAIILIAYFIVLKVMNNVTIGDCKIHKNHSSNNKTDDLERLKKLKELYDCNAITQEEYEKKKKEYFN